MAKGAVLLPIEFVVRSSVLVEAGRRNFFRYRKAYGREVVGVTWYDRSHERLFHSDTDDLSRTKTLKPSCDVLRPGNCASRAVLFANRDQGASVRRQKDVEPQSSPDSDSARQSEDSA